MSGLYDYVESEDARFIIATRNSEYFDFEDYVNDYRDVEIPNFRRRECRKFISTFFDEQDKSEKLIRTLEETNLLEKIPTTPLTLSLLSILFDQEDSKEIPATQADLYKEFTEILLGRLQVSDVLEYLELKYLIRTFRAVCLEMLEKGETEVNISEFSDSVNDFLSRKGEANLSTEEVHTLVNDTGFMYVDSKNNVGFKHSSFLEFFASSEIFNHRRPEYEPKLIDRFDEPHWQNTAVFFAGISNDLPTFVKELLRKIEPESLDDLNVFIGGLGYLSQALYQLDPGLHAALIKRAVDYSYNLLRGIQEHSSHEDSPFHSIKPHTLVVLLSYWFRLNFSSVTLSNRLRLAYDDIVDEIDSSNKFEKSFKLFLISSTLTHKYIGDGSKLLDLTDRECYTNSPVVVYASKIFFDNITLPESEPQDEIQDNIDHHVSRFEEVIDYFNNTPVRKLENDF